MSGLSQILAELVALAPGETATLPERLSQMCAGQIKVTGVGIALMSEEGHEGMVAASDDVARKMEELQFTMGEGPCVEAAQLGRPVLEPDLSSVAAARWPGFGPAAVEAGMAAVFAFPLQVGAVRLGTLDLYRDTPGHLDGRDLALALGFADAALIVLLHLQNQMSPGTGLHPQLGDPLGHQPEIHQATGMITVQTGLRVTEALLLLRARAFADGVPVRDVARDVIERRIRFSPSGGSA